MSKYLQAQLWISYGFVVITYGLHKPIKGFQPSIHLGKAIDENECYTTVYMYPSIDDQG